MPIDYNKKTVELPISAPLFEGHLYLKQDNKWLWRLFRFDGTTLTCLSEKKFKLPPSTSLNRLPGTDSCTSLLLATPKDKSVRITQSIPTFQTQPPQVSYYQLPKWTIDMVNVSSISILKNDKGTHFNLRSAFSLSLPSDKCKTFCIRTFQGECLVMKAQKHQDLERWLFVLTKMWKFAQSIRQFSAPGAANEATQSKPVPNNNQMMRYHHQYNSSSSHQLAPPHLPYTEQRRHSHEEARGGGGMARGIQSHHHHLQPQEQAYPQHPILPEEKVNWIRAWAQSLDELSVHEEEFPEIKTEPSSVKDGLLDSYPIEPNAYPADANQYLVAHNNNKQRRSKSHAYNNEPNSVFPHYFQDTNTEEDDTSQHHGNTKNDGLLTYHTSIKGKNVKFGSTSTLNNIMNKEEPMIPPLFEFNRLSIDSSSPLEKITAYPKQYKRNTHSFQPNTRPYHSNKRASVYVNEPTTQDADEDDENMSLADVKQYLKEKYTPEPQQPQLSHIVH
ncbi:hypothetical protein K501DRAFT_333107 [Backusella circina FSU 941]|nr:hypothetical protein K501DRAFT_333107 [Backusella circina FSU 941]